MKEERYWENSGGNGCLDVYYIVMGGEFRFQLNI